ncbi:hypothetical protein CO178_02255 [candidate division WWE3 bacterium CG_4_9_14_3_um_filter_34_6]|uniref:Small ribosomal subunit protein bS6 n=1 Tax=candidate division WWE3 bacterium CG_4_9_14_3_um_filter_34_6 TaxID=1975079 RepID=A0A2M7X2L8_UNCKA|nr:MAG: hypothetical protein CO178_02255 [candidate division WWE3 bacterium CG_4_9_14_3_um_filter_34_6]
MKRGRSKKTNKIFCRKVASHKGIIKDQDFWGLKDLSYETDKKTKGYYFVCKFELEPYQIAPLETWLKLENDGILRFMISNINE